MDLNFLRPLYAVPGPVASIHLDTTRDTEDADKLIELRWRALRDRLAEQGADDATLDAIADVVGGARGVGGAQGEAIFAAGGRVLAVHTMARPPAADSAAWLPVADPLDLVVDRDHQLPYVVVAIDREGADIDGYEAAEQDPATERSYNGSTLHIQKVRGGGPSQRHYHRRAENQWNENAGQVAKEVTATAAEVGAAVIFVGGDERAIGLMKEHLKKADPPVVEIAGGRSDNEDQRTLRASLDRALEEAMIASHDEALAEYGARVPQDTAVEGVPAVVRALRDGQVEALYLGADRAGEPELWASPDDPMLLATDPSGLDVAGAFQAPASALLLRAAAMSDARFTELLDHGDRTQGTGATLRFTM
ncbi:baeRF2 domain-containing protein [Actinomadura parmotrematis]|uniref:Peptide chain release factor 1 n=1 Tax=Actinomadura parmotrematis TaxID=2864039 RepID=A0ABS7FPI1_9ACTN|nr:Vms1/Ankzf1 family peptidyl-tRNA hydrolase [Actinomadura parmotrematis]MBW8482284.1 hypothetical protein [Actinomadura parmotrematis]